MEWIGHDGEHANQILLALDILKIPHHFHKDVCNYEDCDNPIWIFHSEPEWEQQVARSYERWVMENNLEDFEPLEIDKDKLVSVAEGKDIGPKKLARLAGLDSEDMEALVAGKRPLDSRTDQIISEILGVDTIAKVEVAV